LTKDGSGYSVLHSFQPPGPGPFPQVPFDKHGLIQGRDGTLYGATQWEGTNRGGTVFKLNVDGSGYSLLHGFTDGDYRTGGPTATLVEGSDGVLYGTTEGGGSNDVGTVFKLNKDGSDYNLLHSFSTNSGYCQFPSARVVQGRDGALYGTTSAGGANTNQYGDTFGTVFKLNEDGSGYAVLYSFSSTHWWKAAMEPSTEQPTRAAHTGSVLRLS
jgi:uncharacterized repeat protein (TIGR03803 family)